MRRENLCKIILVFVLSFFDAKADHIVGGNLEMISNSGVVGSYTMRLIVFQNEEFGTGGSETFGQGFMIYRSRDNQKMKYIIANLTNYGEGDVIYFNDSCSQDRSLKTRKLVYETKVSLDPSLYDDPQGYYIVWADGYRNNGLSNIKDPGNTGIMFQLKFPALIQNDKPFVNSSAVFNDINGEYLCVNMPFRVNFDARDPDGDELRYSIVTPFDNFQGLVDVTESEYIGMNNYPLVNWSTGYGVKNVMHGKPELEIDSRTGILSVTPTTLGLFLFSILVDEYRNGKWIGSTRRDYQFLVIDCPPVVPPQPTIKIKGAPTDAVSATFCYGTEAELSVNFNSDWQYQWQKDGRYIPKANGSSLKVSESGQYSVEVAFKTTCGRSVESREVQLLVIGEESEITASSLTVCTGKQVEIFTTNDPSLKYKWLRDGTLLPEHTESHILTSQPGIYKVLTENPSLGCPVSESRGIVLTELRASKPIISATPNVKVACEGQIVTLSTTEASEYEWSFVGVHLAGSENKISADKTGDYVVTITDANGCRAESDPYKIEFSKTVTVTLLPIGDLCFEDQAVTLSGSPAGGVYSGVGVDGADFVPKVAGQGSHDITYTINSNQGCASGSAKQTVYVSSPPVPGVPERLIGVKGEAIHLNANVGEQYNYRWYPIEGLSNPDVADPIITIDNTSTYSVEVVDSKGCTTKKNITIAIGTKLSIPSGFSPNGDGINDEWRFYGVSEYPNLEVYVYNRWGAVVYYSPNYVIPWDGTYVGEKIATGTYPYRIKTKEGILFVGTVTVLH